MSLKMFSFAITNMRTGEIGSFIGDGENVIDALKDGVKNAQSTFRPKNDGVHRDPLGIVVTLKNRDRVKRSIADFESDRPFLPPPPEVKEGDLF